VFKYYMDYVGACDICHRLVKPYCCDEFHLHPLRALQAFEKWDVDLISLINPLARHSKERYTITTTDYLTKWDEV